MAGENPPPNWYPDPGDPNRERYWDGGQWSDQTRSVADLPPPPDSWAPTAAPGSEGQTAAPVPPGGPALGGPSGPSGPSGPGTGPMGGPMPVGAPAPKTGMSTTAKVLIGLGVGTILLLGGCVVAAGLLLSQASETLEDFEAEVQAEMEAQDESADTAPDGGLGAGEDLQAEAIDSASDESGPGSVSEPFPYGEPQVVAWTTFEGSEMAWEVTVESPTDIEAETLAAEDFNEPAPDGVVYAGFPVTMTLLEAEEQLASPDFSFAWEILGGASSGVYDEYTIETPAFGCGIRPDNFDLGGEVLIGGVLSGTVCIPIPSEDLDDPGTLVSMNFYDSRLVFGP